VRLVRKYEAFKETNFTHVFLFLIYDIYNASSLIKSNYTCVMKKFYDFLLNLTAVFKKPPHNRRLSLLAAERCTGNVD